MTDTDVLSHLETSDLFITALGNGNITVIHAENLALFLSNSNLAHSAVAPCSLITAKSDTSDLGSIVLAGKTGECTPATSNIEHFLALLELNLFADNGQLVILKLLESLLLVGVGNDTGSVDHARTKEPAVEVIASVIVVSDLFFVYNKRKSVIMRALKTHKGVVLGQRLLAYPGIECA